jgi:hypothetical protein
MADNLHYTDPGTGALVATDQLLTGEHVQYMKLMDGTLNSNSVVTAANGRLSVEPFSAYTMAYDYDVNGNVIYIGQAYPGNSTKSAAVWRIQKLTYDANSNVTDRQFASGSTGFDQVWNNRVSLSYS